MMKSLVEVGKGYLDLLTHIGLHETKHYNKAITLLCSPDCKKIVNGEIWYLRRKDFLPQLFSIRERVGAWAIIPLDIIPAQDGKTVVVHYLAPTEKTGTWNSLVILRCNDKLLIYEINEVFNSYEGYSL